MAINKHALENWLCPKCGNAFNGISYTTCGMCGQNVVWVKSSTHFNGLIKRSYGVCLLGEEDAARRILQKNQFEKEVQCCVISLIAMVLLYLAITGQFGL